MTEKYTHNQLVEKAKFWLKNAKKCNPVFAEKGSARIGEFPDAIGWNGDKVYQYACSDAWNLSSCSYDTISLSTQDATPLDLFFNSNGSKLYELGRDSNKIYQYSLDEIENTTLTLLLVSILILI